MPGGDLAAAPDPCDEELLVLFPALAALVPKTLATATVDRLLRHAHVVLTEGISLRLSEATAGRGVVPLT